VSETSNIKELQERNSSKTTKNIESKASEIRSDLKNVDHRIGEVLNEILNTNECIRNRFDESRRQNSGDTDRLLKQLSLETKKLVDQQLSYHNNTMSRLHDQNDKFKQFEKKYDDLTRKFHTVNLWEAGIIIALLLLIVGKLFFGR
jgi:chromosome segregation ATPase